MNTPDEIKIAVKNKYAEIARNASVKDNCGTSCCGEPEKKEYTDIQDDYSALKGYVAEADLGLGCGLPTQYAGIKTGDTVVDLGSGAGNDVFIALAIVGNKGKVTGLDMTEEMIEKANSNKQKLGYGNVDFILGDIENMPIENNYADVVVSNCVLNLVPDKKKAFSEIRRILKTGGHFCVSDVVILGSMNNELKRSAELYAGCVSGALDRDEYLKIIKEAGFRDIEIKKNKKVDLPEDLLKEYLSEEGMEEMRTNLKGIFSISVVGYK